MRCYKFPEHAENCYNVNSKIFAGFDANVNIKSYYALNYVPVPDNADPSLKIFFRAFYFLGRLMQPFILVLNIYYKVCNIFS